MYRQRFAAAGGSVTQAAGIDWKFVFLIWKFVGGGALLVAYHRRGVNRQACGEPPPFFIRSGKSYFRQHLKVTW